MGSCGRTRWPARPRPLVLGLGLDYKSLSKERNERIRRFAAENSFVVTYIQTQWIHTVKRSTQHSITKIVLI